MFTDAVPNEPTTHVSENGVDFFAAPPPCLSSSSFACHSGFAGHQQPSDAHNFRLNVAGPIVSFATSFPIQGARNRKRRERHQQRVREKQHKDREQKRRIRWNRLCREQRLLETNAMEQELVPGESPPTPLGHVRIGAINVEKTNAEKLEQLVCLAASRGWEITVVS